MHHSPCNIVYLLHLPRFRDTDFRYFFFPSDQKNLYQLDSGRTDDQLIAFQHVGSLGFSVVYYMDFLCVTSKDSGYCLFFFVNSISCIKHQKSGCYRIIAVSKDIRDYSKIDLNTTSIFFKCFFIFYNNRSLCFGHFKLIFVVKSPYLVVFTVILYTE